MDSFDASWEQFSELLRRGYAEAGYSQELADWMLADAEPFCRRIAAGEPAANVILAMSARHFDVLHGRESPSANRPIWPRGH